MQHIPIEIATEGMVLAKEVKRTDNPAGPPICGKGIELTSALIARLKSMRVSHLCVEGHPVWKEGDKTLDELLADLDRRFRKVRGNPVMERVRDLFRGQLIRSMGGQE